MATPLKYEDLAGQVNQFMTNEAIKPYLANLPNYANMVGSRTENISQQLKGQLPQDVINQIGQQAAERGISGGNPGSPNANAAYLRALGLNSLQMQQQGNQNLSTAIADTPVPQLFNPASLIVPEMLANQELGAASYGASRGGGSASVTGMPNLTARTVSGRPSNVTTQQAAFGSPAVGFNLYSMPQTDPNTLANNWWDSYGGRNISSDMTMPVDYSSGGDFGQFNEEDNYFSGMPNNYVEAAPENAWQGPDYSDPNFDWISF